MSVIRNKNDLVFCLFLITVLSFSLISKIPVYKKIKNILACMGGLLIFIYFYYQGRLIERVVISVFQYCIAAVFLSLADCRKYFWGERKNKIVGSLYALIICAISVPVVFNWYVNILPKPTFALTACSENEHSEKFYSESDIYIWDTVELKENIFEPLMDKGKLPTKEFLDHNISTGDWDYGQKYLSAHYSSIGISNPAADLLKRPDTYYAGIKIDIIKTYLSEHYDYSKEPVKVKDISGVPVWSFQ